MTRFMDDDFLLGTKTAQRLFHEVASRQPIFDYHCHIIPREVAENRRFGTLTEVWLGGDHYKWRAMRSNGVDENLITGTADPKDKFLAWASTMPYLVGNPLYHWTHLELQRFFGIDEPLGPETAPAIWDAANKKLQNDPALNVYGIFKSMNVHAIGTTDDPVDSLEWHTAVRSSGATETQMLPSFRPDKALNIDKPGFTEYIARLGTAADVSINSFSDLCTALGKRIDHFHACGCRASDHALEVPPFRLAPDDEVDAIFTSVLSGQAVDSSRAEIFKTRLMAFLGAEYHARGWVMQLHLAAIRNNNSRMFARLGPDTGFDAVHDMPVAQKLAGLLDIMESQDSLPRTILYSLNPKDYYSFGTLMGCFQGGGIPGKIQLGSGWWFCDHRDGMEEQLRVLGNLGSLPRFIGMLTDSRSFLSYPRHEYFRRILCNLLGNWAEAGEIPSDNAFLDRIVTDISFRNALAYFGT